MATKGRGNESYSGPPVTEVPFITDDADISDFPKDDMTRAGAENYNPLTEQIEVSWSEWVTQYYRGVRDYTSDRRVRERYLKQFYRGMLLSAIVLSFITGATIGIWAF